jgi:hypothetical protein
MEGFRALTTPGTAFIEYYNGGDANLLYVHFRNYRGADHFMSIVINRWHDNVNSMFFEKQALDPTKDSMNFIRGSVGAYPNYFLQVDGEDIPDFFDLLMNFDGSPEYVAKLDKYGVNRSSPEFWDTYEWFQHELDRADPLRAGLYDLSRYHPRAVEQP